MQQLLNALQLASIVTALIAASITTLVAVATQLTSAARLRRKVTFWNEQLAKGGEGDSVELSRSMRRNALAKLVALDARPGWTLAIAMPLLFLAVGYSLLTGSLLRSGLDTFDTRSHMVIVLAPTIIGVIGVSLIMRTLIIRRRIFTSYLNGEELSLAKEKEKFSIFTTLFSWRQPYFWIAWTFGLASILTFTSAVLAFSPGKYQELALVVVILGLCLFGAHLLDATKILSEVSGDWYHSSVVKQNQQRKRWWSFKD